MMRLLLVMLAIVSPAILTPPTQAAQGQGVGTLPNSGVTRRAAWLDAYSTIEARTDPGARLLIVSTHNSEGELMQPSSPPDNPTVLTATWRSRHTTFTISCPMWVSEAEDGQAGSDRWHVRFNRELTASQFHFPPDGT